MGKSPQSLPKKRYKNPVILRTHFATVPVGKSLKESSLTGKKILVWEIDLFQHRRCLPWVVPTGAVFKLCEEGKDACAENLVGIRKANIESGFRLWARNRKNEAKIHQVHS